ncbi:LOW QUALITY PROTEIN: hypothetical protein Cgig2_001339 [Carnegiea gigantea]|uniref:Uncharacterized protein n=1 Tax=Carnegiea gigantea TaxID=171969 RepID=A0A9Q1QNV9_9CARY|nr:LOW QUALITY PROTEIN: hypothetical protein Cgig2_001339 [Carnegiea gigantea]
MPFFKCGALSVKLEERNVHVVSAVRTSKTESKSGAFIGGERYVLGRTHSELETGSKSEVGEEQNWTRKLERKGVAIVVAITHGGVNSRLGRVGKGEHASMLFGMHSKVQVTTLTIDWEGDTSSWRRWEGEGDSYVCFVGGMLVESRDGKVTYEGGSRKCMVVREGMGAKQLLKMVREITRSDMSEEKLWYSLNYDREMLVVVEGDNNVIFKGNDEYGYMYVAENAGPVRRPHARAAVCESRVPNIGEGKQIARSGGKCNDGEEVGEERGNNQAGVKRNYRSLGVEGGELPVSRQRREGIQSKCQMTMRYLLRQRMPVMKKQQRRTMQGISEQLRNNVVMGTKRKGVLMGMMSMTICGHVLGWKPEVIICYVRHKAVVYCVSLTYCGDSPQLAGTYPLCRRSFTGYPWPAAKILPNSHAHTHCAGVVYHDRYYAKPG